MLRQRVITALVLVCILLASLMAPGPGPFAVLTLVLIAAAGWEWGRLNQAGDPLALALAAMLAALCGATLLAGWTHSAPAAAWWLATVLWLGGGFVALRGGPAAWPHLPKAARWVIGLVGLWAAWLAISHARVLGINFMLSVFCVVWMADVAAYFGGKAFGRRKLAPGISPGKSWEGVWSGMAGVLLLAALWIGLDRSFAFDSPSVFSRLLQSLGIVGMALALLVLCAMSVVGDLVESLVKRAAGAKDSSRLLPGHGGVLDRVDALLPVFPITLALIWI
ncbi:phosphatidate cytidylyltransferase [Rubrivivax sp. RP6-9]|uniref:phosphatidate cytidylyltransferase n=1 Tax=Rubrivivax sp. RP6-9 TaxID=3415750 RepID=UPI003CC676C5